jgi:N-acetylneuraminate synthase
VALGARLVEKHFTLSRSVPGPDSAFSLEPSEFAHMVAAIRTAESSLGHVQYAVSEREEASRRFRRSLFVVKDVRRSEIFTAENIRSIRPADGLAPKHMLEVIGKRAATDIERGTPLSWSHIDQ